MPLTIGGKTVDPTQSVDLPARKQGTARLEAIVERLTIHILLDGQEILKAARTIDNIELVADLLSAYGYPVQATQLRKGKDIPR